MIPPLVRLSTVLVAVLSVSAAGAQDGAIVSSQSRFHPVIAQTGMVSSQEALATTVGVDILRAGGNAVDAAVAVGFALAVTLPRAGNIGGGGFMIVHDADAHETMAIDYRETAPAAATEDMFLNDAGDADPVKSRFSGLGVGVPGTVRGLALAHERFGSGNLSWADLIAPAITLARDGFPVSQDLSSSLSSNWVRLHLARDQEAYGIFYGPSDGTPEPGFIMTRPDLADTLEAIALDGPDAFYEGPIAKAIVDKVNATGGRMSLADLAGYEAKLRAPVLGSYQGYTVASMPPPSSGGIHLIQILNILDGLPIAEHGLNSARTIHLMSEAMSRAYADRSAHLGDPDFVDVPDRWLISEDYADEVRAGIDPDRATPSSEIRPGTPPAPTESPETTHYSVVDADGNAVSNTYTLNFSYGVGLVADGTGILLNNELDDFSAKPGVPNAYGLIGGDANAVAGNKRPLSSMTPTIVFKDDKVFLVTGSPGGSRIITTVLQIIVNVIDHGLNVASATAAPRIHDQWLPDEIRIERGISPDTIEKLEEMGHTVALKDAMGSTQSILVTPDGTLQGAADPRRAGALAAGY
ncbi:gamma-glutamyltransferase [Amorphus orientalis]|uniref:Glutathione hydrolase proenzyme n=1 Tax=Amorphus orientalis TaxID=649198 RepID=A0AAE3VL09_9HYPH|nr:gamma-glutamyltransferase [Amorphus orientalis]MDQ0313996.1 gamma-glutamyltranspeptidase/glutathione hydrolase [Amorphus orientalis]